MSRTILLRSPSTRRKSAAGSLRFAEVAGGTTAECSAICCCCPCVVVNFLFLAIYKVPAGLFRRALRMKRRQKLIKKGFHPPRRVRYDDDIDFDTDIDTRMISMRMRISSSEIKAARSEETERKVVELEKEMWEIFYGTGFWRSPSQREPISISISNHLSL